MKIAQRSTADVDIETVDGVCRNLPLDKTRRSRIIITCRSRAGTNGCRQQDPLIAFGMRLSNQLHHQHTAHHTAHYISDLAFRLCNHSNPGYMRQ